MSKVIELVSVFSSTVGVGALMMAVTLLILRRIYRMEAVSIAQRESIFLDRFVAGVEVVSALTHSEYQATAGRRIPNYFDADKLLMMAPNLLEEISSRLVEKLQRYPSAKVCFIEKDSGPVGMLTMEGLIASKLGRPSSIVRPRRDVWKIAVKGVSIGQGDQVILVQDVVTTGFQTLKPIRMLEKLGACVVAVVTLVDREERKDSEFLAKNIDLISILTLSEIQKRSKNTAGS